MGTLPRELADAHVLLVHRDLPVGVVGQHFRAAQRIGGGSKPVEAVKGKAGGVIVRIGQAREQPVRRVSLLQQRPQNTYNSLASKKRGASFCE